MGTGKVTINEIVLGVNIVLGLASIDQFPPFDINHDGIVSVNELSAAIGVALTECDSYVHSNPEPLPTAEL